jgi:Formaldehyde-activating enzyme (Fae)
MTGSQSLASSTPELLGRLTFKRVVSVALVTFAASVLFVGLAAADIVPLEIVLAVPFAVGAVGVAVLLVRPVTNEAAAEADDPTAGSEQTQAEVPTEHGAAVARHEVERAHVRAAEVVPDAPAELTVITESGATFKFKGAFERADEAKIRIYEDHEEEVSTPPRPPMEHVRPTVESSTRAELRAPSVGESLVGDGNEVAHIDLLIGAKAGPVGKAFAGALVNQKEGHTNLLAVVAPNLPAKPDTIIANKVTIKSEK